MKIAIVTATTNPQRAWPCIQSWGLAPGDYFIGVVNSPQPPNFPTREATGSATRDWLISAQYLGTVPAFHLGVDYALQETDAEIIACFHDDLEILDADWAAKVARYFERMPACGLAGFGGALGLGDRDIYQTPYAPEQLARRHFRSNLVDAEAHGIRSLLAEKVACLDGFSQIGRRAFWLGQGRTPNLDNARDPKQYGGLRQWDRPWTYLEQLGLVHHIYDGALGCVAARYGWETWYLPVACRHLGGQTAVGDQGYATWAQTQVADGDHGFWREGHRLVYDTFRDVLPLDV